MRVLNSSLFSEQGQNKVVENHVFLQEMIDAIGMVQSLPEIQQHITNMTNEFLEEADYLSFHSESGPQEWWR